MQTRINKVIILFTLINTIALIVLSITLVDKKKSIKNGFVVNQRVFNEFIGKKELEKKLSVLEKKDKRSIDSLRDLITHTSNFDLIKVYQNQIDSIELTHRELIDQYTSDIWKRLNEYINEYGKANSFSYIFGASGNGSLMYAEETNDITEAVIVYVNKRYAGE